MAEKTVSNNDLEKLRTSGMITKEEVALVVGDVVLAENVITKERRILNMGSVILESTRRVLRD
jgi:hypothetical protein